jgi:C1A family cysteine protease
LSVSSHHERNPTTYKAFNEFVFKYSKVYRSIEEYNAKYLVFEKNHQAISQLKAISTPDNASFEFGVTPFMDLSPEEFRTQYLNLNVHHLQKLKFLHSRHNLVAEGDNAPAAHDWREHGAVTPVKNQGSCGSCWAFSTVGNLEGQYFMKTNKLQKFSEQQLVDCDKVDQGCNGGLMEDAFKHLNTTGAMGEEDYTYTGSDDDCKYNSTQVKAHVTGYRFAASQNETEIAQMLFETGPLAIAINATPLQFYFWGVFDPWFTWICDPSSLNHGVLIVGYGNNGSKDFWIVKNSWGSWWGESGYFRIVKGSGACGVNTYVISADVLPIA